MFFADIIIPVPTPQLYTYSIPENLQQNCKTGMRVSVPFGKTKIHTGVIRKIHQIAPTEYKFKEIFAILDTESVISDLQFQFWEWIARYYMCTLGDVLKAALPIDSPNEHKPKTETYISLNSEVSKENLPQIFEKLEKKSQKQTQLLQSFLLFSNFFQEAKPVKLKEFLKYSNSSLNILNSLIKRNILQKNEKIVNIFENLDLEIEPLSTLNEEQLIVYQQINDLFQQKDVVLLHGVTSSGKTEVYIHLISDAIRCGKQVLYLLPEIALTIQIIQRLKTIFGNLIGIYHSKFNDFEKTETWNRVFAEQDFRIILGVRSSLFLPFKHLGLIIIDEEHENSYKQHDSAPRYNARDGAIMLAKMHGAKTLLGTATPCIETYFNAQIGKYGLVELQKRYSDIEMPEILTVDVREFFKKRQMKSHFSPVLLQFIENALNNNEQIILFQNRRGYSPYLECETCGWIPECEHCDVSLTYHKDSNSLVCHYCGFSMEFPSHCLACGDYSLRTKGFGTEKIETEIATFFPSIKTARMDLDTTRSKKSYQKIISDFESRKIDILVGTQMISKGLNFDNVSIVGIMNADAMLNFPDFRADERSFQLITQVSGRAGRRYKRGKVIIQTQQPEHPILKFIEVNDFFAMYLSQLAERKKFLYPPFFRLIQLTLRHKHLEVVKKASTFFAEMLRKELNLVLGPTSPAVSRVKNYHLKNILIKIDRKISPEISKNSIQTCINLLKSSGIFNSGEIIINVDPL